MVLGFEFGLWSNLWFFFLKNIKSVLLIWGGGGYGDSFALYLLERPLCLIRVTFVLLSRAVEHIHVYCLVSGLPPSTNTMSGLL